MSAPDDAASCLLFVYGTLRAGGENAELMAGCTLVRSARVAGTIYDIEGEYPALVLSGSDEVEGEIWRCPPGVIRRLDGFEGLDHGLFRRESIVLGGVECWAYVAGPALAEFLAPQRRIAGGRWPGAVG